MHVTQTNVHMSGCIIHLYKHRWMGLQRQWGRNREKNTCLWYFCLYHEEIQTESKRTDCDTERLILKMVMCSLRHHRQAVLNWHVCHHFETRELSLVFLLPPTTSLFDFSSIHSLLCSMTFESSVCVLVCSCCFIQPSDFNFSSAVPPGLPSFKRYSYF